MCIVQQGPLEYRAQVSTVVLVDSIHSFIDGRLSASPNGRAHSADRSPPNRSHTCVETIQSNQLILLDIMRLIALQFFRQIDFIESVSVRPLFSDCVPPSFSPLKRNAKPIKFVRRQKVNYSPLFAASSCPVAASVFIVFNPSAAETLSRIPVQM